MSRFRRALRAFRLSYLATGVDMFRVEDAFVARCAVNPADAVVVVPAEERECVAIQIIDSSVSGPAVVLLAPDIARAFGAGVLNAADAADGTVPLNFIPLPFEEPGR